MSVNPFGESSTSARRRTSTIVAYEIVGFLAIIVLVAIPVVVLTRRLVTRLHYLEEFLRLCAWCRKLHMDNEWIPVEEFLQRRFDTRTSHGICPACRAEQRKAAGARRAS